MSPPDGRFGRLTPRASEERRALLLAVSAASTAVVLWLGAVGWGGWRALLAHPARAAFVVVSVVATLVALLSLAWLMPFMDRRGMWTLDGDGARYAGVGMLVVGGVLRIWPMFVLGRRFSGLVAIQPGHALVTGGPYRYVRHPSYLGMMLGFFGWALVFRSSVGVVAGVLGLGLLDERIAAEEALLASQFGEEYAAYRRRTWRLVPGY